MEKIVLICVDDQQDVLMSVSRDLAPFSSWVQIEECESADEALSLIDDLEENGRSIGLIVSDHLMPGRSGVEFLTMIASRSGMKHVKKVLITGQATHADTISAINQAQIDGYVEKPWEPEKLRKLCHRLLTEYLFDAGKDMDDYMKVAEPGVLLKRMR